jgi:hypothetical protein
MTSVMDSCRKTLAVVKDYNHVVGMPVSIAFSIDTGDVCVSIEPLYRLMTFKLLQYLIKTNLKYLFILEIAILNIVTYMYHSRRGLDS